jgi:hypothetical protein
MKSIEELQSELAVIVAKIDEAVKNEIELRFRFISEDIYKWLQEGGCLECNGTGVAFPWKDCLDTIDCPACDGTSPAYSLSCVSSNSNVDSHYFPEPHYSLMDAASNHHRQTNKKWKVVPFWTASREREKAALANATHSLRLEKAAMEDSIRALKLNANSATSVPTGLPNLSGVSPRQVGFGKACRTAAIVGKHITETEAAKFHDSRYWIDNFKHLLGR